MDVKSFKEISDCLDNANYSGDKDNVKHMVSIGTLRDIMTDIKISSQPDQKTQCEWCNDISMTDSFFELPFRAVRIYYDNGIREYVLAISKPARDGGGFKTHQIVINNCPNCGKKL